ncbi:MAG TPA: hypothetical protein GX534_00915 [Thermoanaerobacterales bacterium]|jgi:hypothetical protein|nr:hypothetical protein [Thermoanaerobacterales bacterium]
MKKINKIFLSIFCLIIFSVFAMTVKADIPEPGSEGDPIVTKSYVDGIIQNLKQYIDAKSGGSNSLEVIYLAKGEKLIGSKGTEIILRSGNASVIDSIGGGLADVTAGKDLTKVDKAPKNHLLIVPRDDGRGIIAESNVVVIVRGDISVTK